MGILPLGIFRRIWPRTAIEEDNAMSPTRTPSSALPLKPTVFLIMLAIANEEGHGYRIRKEVERRSNGTVRLDPGTLYRHIGRLLEDGLIEESDHRPDPDLDDARRRYYRLTLLGKEVVAAEAGRMANLVEVARAKNLIKRARPA